VAFLFFPWSQLAAKAQTPPSSGASGTVDAELQREKLRAQIRQLEIANENARDSTRELLAWAPFITALVGALALAATFWKQASEAGAARKHFAEEQANSRAAADRWQQEFRRTEAESRQLREEESLRRFDTNLAQVIGNLGDDSETRRVSAAAALATYLKPAYKSFHCDILTVVAANLRLRPSDATARMLASDLERLLRLIANAPADYEGELPATIDLARSHLKRLNISGLDLSTVVFDVAFADLTEARLDGCQLFRLKGGEAILERATCSRSVMSEARMNGARCQGAKMHETKLMSATLKAADLRDVEFVESHLQAAHFEGARLEGANFHHANLADAYFHDATFDEPALRSIATGAYRWRDDAHFDPPIKRTLEALV
jgi:uncharacterized protein YjbI with pentapeptide repeats